MVNDSIDLQNLEELIRLACVFSHAEATASDALAASVDLNKDYERIAVSDVVDTLVQSGVTLASIDRALSVVMAQQKREAARQVVLADLELPADARQIDIRNEIVFRNLRAEVLETIQDGSLFDSIVRKGRAVNYLSTCGCFSDERESIRVHHSDLVRYDGFPIHLLDIPLKFGGETSDHIKWYHRWKKGSPLTIQSISSPALRATVKRLLLEGFSVKIVFFGQLNAQWSSLDLKMSFVVSSDCMSMVSCRGIRVRDVLDGDLRMLCLL